MWRKLNFFDIILGQDTDCGKSGGWTEAQYGS